MRPLKPMPSSRWGIGRFCLSESKCTLSAHRLHICPNRGRFCARLAQPAFLCIKMELVGARPLHLAYARPFCRLKAPLGLSLLRCAAQTRTFENTLISAECKKKRGKLWQKERGPDGASPLDKAFNDGEKDATIDRCFKSLCGLFQRAGSF